MEVYTRMYNMYAVNCSMPSNCHYEEVKFENNS